MIYLVTNKELPKSSVYETINVKDSLEILKPLENVGLDTETKGFSPYLKPLLSLQLGCYDFQVVIDCLTVDVKEYKDFIESGRLMMGWNLKFDLKFLYYNGIIPRNVYDGFLIEKVIWQGYPSGMHSLSLKTAGYNYCDVELDKTVRGQIQWKGLYDDTVIKYAADDVKYLETIREGQLKVLKEKGLQRFIDVDLENKALPAITYLEYCGVRIDETKWKDKMANDNKKLENSLAKLNQFIVDFYEENKSSSSDYSINMWYDFSKGNPTGEWKLCPNVDYTTLSPCKKSEGNWKYITRKFPFVKIDYQGDLFSGFDTSPKCTINWNSTQQVIPILEYFGFNLLTKDKKTGQMKKSVEASIIEKQLDVHPIAKVYLEYKETQKVCSTYGQNVLDLINPVTKRIHSQYNQIGTDTFRLSSGGGEDTEVIPGKKVPLINLQNLPATEETRSCFIAENGNVWISIDYSSEESVILANISRDKAMIDLFTNGCKDLHSLVAKMVFKDELKDIPVEKIRELRPDLRRKAKSPEFTFAYGGDANTLVQKDNIPIEEATQIERNYREGFPEVAKYQDNMRREVMKLGYIDECPEVGYRTYIYDFDSIKEFENKTKEQGFWDKYRYIKDNDPKNPLISEVRHFMKRKSASTRQSINYRIQSRGSAIFKISAVYFFNWIVDNGLFNIVKFCIAAHDEWDIEAPVDIADKVANKLHECMLKAGRFICTIVPLEADISYDKNGKLPNYWIH